MSRPPGEVVVAHIGNYCATAQVGLEAHFKIAEAARKRLDVSPADFLTYMLQAWINDHAEVADFEAARRAP